MHFTFILPKNFKSQTIKCLLEETWLVPRKQRHFLRTKKHILVNGKSVNWQEMVKSGDEIAVKFDDDDFQPLHCKFGNSNLAKILYEDEHLVIANKPEGMKTHGNSPDELALQNHVAAAVNSPVFVVHRLDMETSGAVLFAKNQFVLPILGRMLENREIHREYVALVNGQFSRETLTIDLPIGKHRNDKRKRIVSNSGQKAITHVTILEQFDKTSLVKCILDTGRTHQIRVHLAHINHPIIGDPLYGQKNARLMLHARQITLQHPFTLSNLTISAPSDSFSARYEQEQSHKNQSNR